MINAGESLGARERPSWQDHGSSRDPKIRFPVGNRCFRYGAGHRVHYLAAKHLPLFPSRTGHLVACEDDLVTLDFDGEIVRGRNHESARLIEIADAFGTIAFFNTNKLAIPGGSLSCYLFSLADLSQPLTECYRKPPRQFAGA